MRKDKSLGKTTNKTELLLRKLSKDVFGFEERQEKTTDIFVSIMTKKKFRDAKVVNQASSKTHRLDVLKMFWIGLYHLLNTNCFSADFNKEA